MILETKKKKNVLPTDILESTIGEYLKEIYDSCTPSFYGDQLPKKIVWDTFGQLKFVPSCLSRGDLHKNYDKFFEVKISYISKNESYNITHIRPWQDFDYYLLCFVDLDKEMYNFYCVSKEVITNNPELTLGEMNNPKELNEYNEYVGMRITIKSDDVEWLIGKHNVLDSTDYNSLLKFISTI